MNNFSHTFISIIIPVFNDNERLFFCLKALEKQTYPKENYEIIIVDNGSDKSVYSISNKFARVKVDYEAKPGSYSARNKGILLAKGEILAFTDSDCIPAEDWLKNGVEQLLKLNNKGVIAGNINMFYKNPKHPNSVEIYDSITHLQQEKMVTKAHFGATANLFTSKKVFENVGLFNSELKSGGDAEWGKRAYDYGYPIVYADDCCVAHPCRNSLSSILKKAARVSGGRYKRTKLAQKKQNNYTNYVKAIFRLRPPLLYAYRKIFFDPGVESNIHKIQVLLIILVVFYRKQWETIRLNFGQIAKR